MAVGDSPLKAASASEPLATTTPINSQKNEVSSIAQEVLSKTPEVSPSDHEVRIPEKPFSLKNLFDSAVNKLNFLGHKISNSAPLQNQNVNLSKYLNTPEGSSSKSDIYKFNKKDWTSSLAKEIKLQNSSKVQEALKYISEGIKQGFNKDIFDVMSEANVELHKLNSEEKNMFIASLEKIYGNPLPFKNAAIVDKKIDALRDKIKATEDPKQHKVLNQVINELLIFRGELNNLRLNNPNKIGVYLLTIPIPSKKVEGLSEEQKSEVKLLFSEATEEFLPPEPEIKISSSLKEKISDHFENKILPMISNVAKNIFIGITNAFQGLTSSNNETYILELSEAPKNLEPPSNKISEQHIKGFKEFASSNKLNLSTNKSFNEALNIYGQQNGLNPEQIKNLGRIVNLESALGGVL